MSIFALRSNGLASSAYKNLSRAQTSLTDNISRLASGLRINKTADDSAGSNVSVRMGNQVSGMAQANRNAQDTNNLLATAESGLSDISDILGKMRQLSVQASTDTLNDNDRASINLEFQALKDELTRIANVTEYNGMNLLNGTYQTAGGETLSSDKTLVGHWTFEPGEELKDLTGNFPDIILKGAKITNGQLDVDTEKWAIATGEYTGPTVAEKTLVSWASLDDINVHAGSILTIDKLTNDQFDAIVFAESQTNRWMAGSSNFDRTEDLNPGFEETETGQQVMIAISYEENGNNTRIKAYRNGDLIGSYEKGPLAQWPKGDAEIFWGLRHGSAGGGPGNLDAHIEESRIYGVVLDQDEIKNLIEATGAGGADGTAEGDETWAGSGPESLFNAVSDDGYVGDQGPGIYNQVQPGTSASSDPHGPPDNIRGHWRVQIGADNDINSQHEFSLTNATANGLDLEDDNVLAVDDARTAITAIDHAIDEVNRERSYIGSEQNKLQFTMSNLSSNIQNIEASRSSIEDADFAAEAADLAKNQILAQSATAMLAQASAISQNILSLLR